MAFTGSVLSGSSNGKIIPVTATGTPGTLIHTAALGTGFDEVYIFASNVTGADAKLTIQWGGTSDPADHLIDEFVLPPHSPQYPISPGCRIQNGLSIRAFSNISGAINISGWYNRSQ